jgi:hypothetical protein
LQAGSSSNSPAGVKGKGAAAEAPSAFSNEDKNRLLTCIAFQNAFIEFILSQNHEKLKLAAAHELADAHKRIEHLEKVIRTQAAQSASETASLSVRCDRLTNIAIGGADVLFGGGYGGSRPLSRTSLMDTPHLSAVTRHGTAGGGSRGIGGEQRPPLLLPPRPHSSQDSCPVESRPLSRVSNLSSRPLVATKLEDLDGEKERRLLQVIKSQGDIIKDMQARGLPVTPLQKSQSIIRITGSTSSLNSSLSMHVPAAATGVGSS